MMPLKRTQSDMVRSGEDTLHIALSVLTILAAVALVMFGGMGGLLLGMGLAGIATWSAANIFLAPYASPDDTVTLENARNLTKQIRTIAKSPHLKGNPDAKVLAAAVTKQYNALIKVANSIRRGREKGHDTPEDTQMRQVALKADVNTIQSALDTLIALRDEERKLEGARIEYSKYDQAAADASTTVTTTIRTLQEQANISRTVREDLQTKTN